MVLEVLRSLGDTDKSDNRLDRKIKSTHRLSFWQANWVAALETAQS